MSGGGGGGGGGGDEGGEGGRAWRVNGGAVVGVTVDGWYSALDHKTNLLPQRIDLGVQWSQRRRGMLRRLLQQGLGGGVFGDLLGQLLCGVRLESKLRRVVDIGRQREMAGDGGSLYRGV